MTWRMLRARWLAVVSTAVLGVTAVGPFVPAHADADTRRPSAPQLTSGVQVGPSSISFRWTLSNDDVGVAGYRFLRNGVVIDDEDIIDTFSNVADIVVPGGNAWIQVQAFDAAGNFSAKSSPLRIPVDSRQAVAPDLLSAVFDPETECVDVTFRTNDWRGVTSHRLISNRLPLNLGRVPDFRSARVEPFGAREEGPVQTATTCLLPEGRNYLQLRSDRVSGLSVKTPPLVIDVPEISPAPRVDPPDDVTAQIVQFRPDSRSIVVRWDDPGPLVSEIVIRSTFPEINGVSGSTRRGESARSERASVSLPAGIEAPYTIQFQWIDRFGDPSEFSEPIVLDPNAPAPIPATDVDAVVDAASGCLVVSFDVSEDQRTIGAYRVLWGGDVVATLPGSSPTIVEPRRIVELCDLESGRRGVGVETSIDGGVATLSGGALVAEIP